MKLYENKRKRAFNIIVGTGKPDIIITTPRVWLEESIAKKYPQWFSEITVDEIVDEVNEEIKDSSEYVSKDDTTKPTPNQEIKEGEIEDFDNKIKLYNIDEIMDEANKIQIKKKLDEFASQHDIKLDRRKSLKDMKRLFEQKLNENR